MDIEQYNFMMRMLTSLGCLGFLGFFLLLAGQKKILNELKGRGTD